MSTMDQGSSSDEGVLAPPVGRLDLLCEVRPSIDQVAPAGSAFNSGQGDVAQCQIRYPNLSMCCCSL